MTSTPPNLIIPFPFPPTLNPRRPSFQPCGGAIPLCMVDEFDIPAEIIDRKVTKMKMISPSNREVDVGYVFFFSAVFFVYLLFGSVCDT